MRVPIGPKGVPYKKQETDTIIIWPNDDPKKISDDINKWINRKNRELVNFRIVSIVNIKKDLLILYEYEEVDEVNDI